MNPKPLRLRIDTLALLSLEACTGPTPSAPTQAIPDLPPRTAEGWSSSMPAHPAKPTAHRTTPPSRWAAAQAGRLGQRHQQQRRRYQRYGQARTKLAIAGVPLWREP